MHIGLFTMDGILFIFRWLHVFFGIIWIGILYYFNFVQGATMPELDAGAKSGVLTKLLPRALWWFRYAALFTVITGLLLITGYVHTGMPLMSAWGVTILIGMAMGLIMASNVWFIIWPNQQVVIANATAVAAGGQANPAAAAAGAKALLASRTNALFSIPLVFFMLAGRHFGYAPSDAPNYMAALVVSLVIMALIELNALFGKLGPITTIKGVIHFGFLLSIVFYAVAEYFI